MRVAHTLSAATQMVTVPTQLADGTIAYVCLPAAYAAGHAAHMVIWTIPVGVVGQNLHSAHHQPYSAQQRVAYLYSVDGAAADVPSAAAQLAR